MKTLNVFMTVLVVLLFASGCGDDRAFDSTVNPTSSPILGTLAKGQPDEIQAQISFVAPWGQTTTNPRGTTYQSGPWSFFEPKIYASSYWGIFPLYPVGSTMRFDVYLTNTVTKGNKSFKLRVQGLNRVLETDGSLGMEIAPPQEWVIESLAPGETKILEGSIYIAPNPDLPSGLDDIKIRISHLNEGANENAGLIKTEMAIYSTFMR